MMNLEYWRRLSVIMQQLTDPCSPPRPERRYKAADLGPIRGRHADVTILDDGFPRSDMVEELEAEQECRGIELGSGECSGCDQSGGDCPTCGK